jgi:pimeloyl-ACP methyl ester carboxylesterase
MEILKHMKTILIFALCIAIISCGSSEKTKENIMENEVYEKTFVQINGFEQGMFIKGKNINNPVLLFLHGGPGMPEYGLTQKYPTNLEENFIVCWWEQRGAGVSSNKNIKPEDLTVENFVSDTVEVANYLRERFNQDKIYLMGHSWGSFIGLKTVKQSSELFYAYIGVAQTVYQLESEKIAYEYMLEQYKNNNNKRMVKKMEKFDIPNAATIPVNYALFRDKSMHELGIGTMHEMKSVISGIFLPIMQNKEYTFSERINIWRAKSICLNKTNLWDTAITTDLTAEITSVEIPVYFMHGIYDYTVNYSLTKEYYKKINSPLKGFYTFEHSAHSPIFEEPEKVNKILLNDVIKGTNNNRDSNI